MRRGRLVFASARDGVPALYLVGADGTGLARLTNRRLTAAGFAAGARGVVMPEGGRPPVWLGDQVIFEAAGGVYAVSAVDGAERWRLPGADWPHLGAAGLVVRQGGPGGTFHPLLPARR